MKKRRTESKQLASDEQTAEPTDGQAQSATDSQTESPTDSPAESATDSPAESPTNSQAQSATDGPAENATDSPANGQPHDQAPSPIDRKLNSKAKSPRTLPSDNSASKLQLPTIYKRNRWQHFVRFVALGGIMALDFGLLGSAISHHMTRTFTLMAIGKEALAYFMVLLCNLAVLPSILLEANTVEVTNDRLILNNLLFRTSLPWAEITSVVAPVYLKFAIIKTKRFFYLLNKRDIDQFTELINTIREKVGAPAN